MTLHSREISTLFREFFPPPRGWRAALCSRVAHEGCGTGCTTRGGRKEDLQRRRSQLAWPGQD